MRTLIFVDEIPFFCWKDKRPEMKDEIAGPAIDDISEVWHYLLYVLFCFSLDLLPP